MARILVTTTEDVIAADDGVVSLREAIIAANETQRGDTIVVSRDLEGPLLVEEDLPEIEADLAFDGNGIIIDHGSNDLFIVDGLELRLAFEDFSTFGTEKVFDIEGFGHQVTIDDYSHEELSADGDIVLFVGGAGHQVDISNSLFRAVNADGTIDIDANISEVSLNRVEMDLTGAGGEEEGIEIDGLGVTLDIRNSSFANHGSSVIDADGGDLLRLNVTGSEFVNNGIGIKLDTDEIVARLTNNTFENNGAGVEINSDEVSLFSFRNDFIANDTGIDNISAAIERPQLSLFDDFEDNDTAIDNDASDGTFTVRFANFAGNGVDVTGAGDTDLGAFV